MVNAAVLRLVAALVPLLVSASLLVSPVHDDEAVELIVTGTGSTEELVGAVTRAGGRVTLDLHLVRSVAAEVPGSMVGRLADDPAVELVSFNRPVHVQADGAARPGPQAVYHEVTGADQLTTSGLTGRGMTVALVDTGVAPVDDLAGRLVQLVDPVTGAREECVDFSGEGHCGDSYGHGTFMAGIIAGDGSLSGHAWPGVAPGARILSLKVAGADGSSDVGKVLAAIQWVVSHRDDHDIRVLNLSLGTDSTQDWDVDPLNYAVERAWEAGIVVSVAASNRGPQPGTISKPADDPWVITVGAVDDWGTVPLGDDRLPDFSSRGPTASGVAKPDVVAPGARIISLRAPGSTIDEAFPSSFHKSYRRGSGTSMATAVVSGGLALMLEADPARTPDELKQALKDTARPVATDDPMAVGAGMVNLAAAAFHAPATVDVPTHHSSGRGPLDLTRGSVTVSEDAGALLMAGTTILWDPVGYTTGEWTAKTWPLSTWAVQEWPANHWYGNNWHGNNWHGDWESDGDELPVYGQPGPGAAWYGVWD